MTFEKKAKIIFLSGDIAMLLLTVALLPINLFVCSFPAWVVAGMGFAAVAGAVVYVILFPAKAAAKILLPAVSALLAAAAAVLAFTVPYWNSCNFRRHSQETMGFREALTCGQAESDLDEVVSLLERIHPMFCDRLTDEIRERHEEAKTHLEAKEQITVNDLRREIQWMLNPMHDAHTTTGNGYPDDRYLSTVPERFDQGYHIVSVNEMDAQGLLERAEPYVSYETENGINVDVGSLASLEFYGITAPWTFVWETEDGRQLTETYTENDFVSSEEYMAIRDSFTEDAQAKARPFVYYEIDEERSLAVLTLRECNTGDTYNDCVRQMFTEVKEKNIQNVAVDLRDNHGGNSGVANEFIRYLPVDEYSDSPSDWRWNFFTFRLDGKVKNDRCRDLAFAGNVYILTNHNSFSSAMLFPQMIQDNGLGRVIGEAPANSTNSYGDIAWFQLKESGLILSISTKKWYRIDSENPDDYVIPDYTCRSEDVFETLYEAISKQNAAIP